MLPVAPEIQAAMDMGISILPARPRKAGSTGLLDA
jgi:hypothetical protein